MCIAILSTAHPQYPFILLSNRDEVLSRPTQRADWWAPPHAHILGGRDAQRPERGTWLGITQQGRFAVLTNFRDPGVEVNRDKSRGAMPLAFLTRSAPESDAAFAQRLMDDVGIDDVGGFSLLFGRLRAPRSGPATPFPGLAIVSNRSTSSSSLRRIATHPGETHALSNSHFGDTSWPKTVLGEKLLAQAIHDHSTNPSPSPQHEFLDSLFSILSIDTLAQRSPSQSWTDFTNTLRNSIYISPAKGDPLPSTTDADHLSSRDPILPRPSALPHPAQSPPPLSSTSASAPDHDPYATHKQTVILVDVHGRVTFTERTLFNELAQPVCEPERTRTFEFQIEGWEDGVEEEKGLDGSGLDHGLEREEGTTGGLSSGALVQAQAQGEVAVSASGLVRAAGEAKL